MRLVGIAGELDLHSVAEAKGPLDRAALDGERSLVIDLTSCEFIDSTGLATIVHATRPLRESGNGVSLVCPHGDVRKLLELAAINLTFPIHDDLDEALANGSRPGT